jgi:hypothetical protein
VKDKNMKKYILPVLIALSALSVSASAAYYSITGLSKLFAGASFAIIIMASSLEVAKLVIASFLYQYWTSVNKFLKTYLAIALGVLILITSAGIYGFLSSAYQSTASKNIVVEKQIAALETKKANYTKTRDGYAKDKEQVSKSTSDLRSGLTTGTITQYKDRSGQIMNVANTGNRKSFEKQLESTTKEEEKLSGKIDILNDSILSLDNQILNAQSNAEVTSELGPLKYISTLLDVPMDKIINWFILVIILVFDPLAISLVIAANLAFQKLKQPQQLAIYDEKPIEIPIPQYLDPNNPPAVAPAIPPPPMTNPLFSFIPSVFRKKRNDEDEIKTY